MSHDLDFTVSSPDFPGLQGSIDMNNSSGGVISDSTGPRTGLAQSSHPVACVFHCLFKGLAIFLYIFGGFFASDGRGGVSGANFIAVTVGCILLLAADFWVVKNITGRLLVGLRWWNQVEGESTKWIFESANRPVNKFDNTVFWTVLYLTPVVWFALLFIGVLKFELGWLMTVCMAMALSFANVYGYYKCSSDQKAKFQQMMAQGAQAGAMTAIRSNLFGILAGSMTATPANASQGSSTYV
jgi:hypothetical protein